MHSSRPFVLALVLILFTLGAVHAQGITVEKWRGYDVLKLSGPIYIGQAEEVKEKIQEVEVRAHGARVLLLDSPGGDVDEAFEISSILDQFRLHTVVPNGANCASACASILFVAGEFRTVEAFGTLGQHSCSVNGLPDEQCNKEIAAHAVAHGVSQGSILAFVTYTSPDEILWFTREDADGWGITRYPGEEASGFEKSEPRVLQMLTGVMPPAQAAWRLDFFGDGFRAFLRPVSDADREMQLNVFCYESLPGRLFISMEIHGPRIAVEDAIVEVQVLSTEYGWRSSHPWIMQEDSDVTSVTIEVPPEWIRAFLNRMDDLAFTIDYKPPFQQMRAATFLAPSRQNLVFAANNCAKSDYDLSGRPLDELR